MAANQRILTINGGSSSIKVAVFDAGNPPQRLVDGAVERIGLPGASLRVKSVNPAESFVRAVKAPDQAAAVSALMDWVTKLKGHDALTAVGHRVVHGGPTYGQPARITATMVEELRRVGAVDPEHLPEEILLVDAVRRPGVGPRMRCGRGRRMRQRGTDEELIEGVSSFEALSKAEADEGVSRRDARRAS
jgi:acetate kinase